MKREFYRPDEVAEMLRIGRTTVYRLMDMGDLRYNQIRGQKRIPAEALESYLHETRGDPLDTKAVPS